MLVTDAVEKGLRAAAGVLDHMAFWGTDLAGFVDRLKARGIALTSTTGNSSLSTTSLAGISVDKIEALSPEQLAAFTSTQWAAMQPAQLLALPT